MTNIGPGDALIVVDVQNDFCPGGALAIKDGDDVVPVLNRWIERFRSSGLPVAYTQDWHPGDHMSFSDRGGPWPHHCVINTEGAAFHPDLKVDGAVFRKGSDKDLEAYSGFDGYVSDGSGSSSSDTDGGGNDGPADPEGGDAGPMSLSRWLRSQKVKRVFVGGLATDYCVRATVLDAIGDGFEAVVISAGSKAVDVEPGDGARALEEMRSSGAAVVEDLP